MKYATLIMTMTAASLAVTPALAAPVNPAASLSIVKARASTPAAHRSKLAGGGAVIAGIAAVAVIAGVIIVASDDKGSSR